MRVNTGQAIRVRRSFGLLAIATMGALPSLAAAQTYNWISATDSTFTTPGAWSGGIIPTSAATGALTFGGAGGYVATNDSLTVPFLVNSLTNSATGAVTIAGSTLTFSGSTPRIVQSGSGSLSFTGPVQLGATTTLSGTGTGPVAFSGGLVYSGGLTGTATGGLIKSSTADLTLSGATSLGFVGVTSGTVNFSGGTHALTTTTVAPVQNSNTSAQVGLTVGSSNGQSGAVNISGGAVVTSTAAVFIGNATGSTAAINISGGSSLTLTDTVNFVNSRFGTYQGTSTINVSGGSTVSALSFELGRGTNTATAGITSTATFTGSGTVGTFVQALIGSIALSNVGLTITDGARIQGITSVFVIGVGRASTAVVNVTNGATLDGGVGQIQTANGANSNVTFNVDNATVFSAVGFLGIGANSTTTLNVANGGTFDGQLQTGLGAGASTFININNGGSITANGFFLGNTVGATLTRVNVNNGGLLNLVGGQSNIGDGPSSVASLTVAAGGSVIAGPASIFTIGLELGAQGTVLVDGGNFNSTGRLVIGSTYTAVSSSGSVGNLIVQNGGIFNIADVQAGRNTTGQTGAVVANILVTGAGSQFNQVGFQQGMFIGLSPGSFGNFTVAAGATATADLFSLGTFDGTAVAFATGSVTFTGAGTTGTVVGQTAIGDALFARGSFTITNNATVTATGTNFLAPEANSIGLMTVSNSGTYNGTAIQVSVNGTNVGGTGSLVVTTGGKVNLSAQLFVGTTGTVTMTGGTITARSLNRGSEGTVGSTGALVLDGGELVLNGSTLIAPTLSIAGTRLRGTNGTLTVNGPNLVELFNRNGNDFSGTVNVEAGQVQVFGQSTAILLSAQLNVGAAGVFVASTNNDLSVSQVRTVPNATVSVRGLSIVAGGLVDVEDNDMVIDGGVANEATFRGFVKAYLDGTLAQGLLPSDPGFVQPRGLGSIYSTLTSNTTLAVFNNDSGSGVPFYSQYGFIGGLDTTDLIIKYTFIGDVNIDGIVDGADLSQAIEGLSIGATGWKNGDVNYDGVVNAVDIAIISTNIGLNLGSLGNGQGETVVGGAVPEPTALGLLAIAVPMLSRRRR